MNARTRDLLLALAVAGIVIAGSLHVHPDADHARAIDVGAWACGLTAALALAGWRRFPVPMAGIVVAAVFVYQARNYPGGPALLPGPVVLVLLGYRSRRPVAWGGAAAMAAAVIAGGAIGRGSLGALDVASTGWVVAAVLAGQIAGGRVERRELARRQAATDERLRIAQDLHDSVAHAMATINVQAGVAGHLLDRRPEQVRIALEAIRSASSEVLDELGAIVTVLRQGGDAPRAPVAGLDRLDDLIARARADGLPVECAVTGDLAGVPPARGAAAFRVVQEALSNTRRHAGSGVTARVRVMVDRADGLTVEVDDDGGRARVPVGPCVGNGRAGSGLGLVGMRERVGSTGGELHAGPTGAGGFRVEARWR